MSNSRFQNNISFASEIHFIPKAIDVIQNCGRPLALPIITKLWTDKAGIKAHVQ